MPSVGRYFKLPGTLLVILMYSTFPLSFLNDDIVSDFAGKVKPSEA